MSEPGIARILTDQRSRWARGDRVPVEAYVQQYPALLADAEMLLDLIYSEVYLREQKGETPGRDEYMRRFPHLARPICEQFDVHQAIQVEQVSTIDVRPPTVPGWELREQIGQGGMARVHRARHEKLGTIVAVKLLRDDHLRNAAVRKRFVAEARAASILDHPHIIKVFEVGECVSGPYIVMELIEGISLEEVIRCRRGAWSSAAADDAPSLTPPSPMQAVEWLVPVAEAVDYAHGKGIIHRDLKPANIMIDAAGAPRVMDFGMAKILRQAGSSGQSSTQHGTILGTPAYMPPEQAGDTSVRVGAYSDVYSLGAVLYALLTGRPPFSDRDFLRTLLRVRSAEPPAPVRALRPEVPDALAQVCHKCLNKRPEERYASARELAETLRRFVQPVAPPGLALPVCLLSIPAGERIVLAKETTVIGRADECDLVLRRPDVSRRHCRIVRLADQVIVEDLGSSQGTRINSVAVLRGVVKYGDRVEVAGQVFQVLVGGAP
jgi:serine/threonine-protein kinase